MGVQHPLPQLTKRMALANARARKRLATGNDPLPALEPQALADAVITDLVRRRKSVPQVKVRYGITGQAVRAILHDNRIPTDLITRTRSSK